MTDIAATDQNSVNDALATVRDRIQLLETQAAALLAYQKRAFEAPVADVADPPVELRTPAPMAAVHDDADGFDRRFHEFASSEESHDETSRRWLLGA